MTTDPNPLGLTCAACGDVLAPDPGGDLANCLDGGGPLLVCPRGCRIDVDADALDDARDGGKG